MVAEIKSPLFLGSNVEGNIVKLIRRVLGGKPFGAPQPIKTNKTKKMTLNTRILKQR
jgi:hypothetical protein